VAEPGDDFVAIRDRAVAASRAVITLVSVEDLDRAIDDGERAQALGPVLDATLWQRGTHELADQLRLMRALRTFRRELEAFRPREEADRGC
jgi:tetratricopeptide (TPR) repeat protein